LIKTFASLGTTTDGTRMARFVAAETQESPIARRAAGGGSVRQSNGSDESLISPIASSGMVAMENTRSVGAFARSMWTKYSRRESDADEAA
jgi:hypothetical protein